jgi:tRNA-dihydrouridine synthase A
MAEPDLVADCVRAMREAVRIPITVKHRLGLNRIEDFSFVERFVSQVSEAGCGTFIVHARNAVLKGLSPKENREVPPLKHDWVVRLKRDFPALEIVLNGGITRNEPVAGVDGIMLGRAAYHDPWVLADVGRTRREVVLAMHAYLKRILSNEVRIRNVARHILGLYHGHRRARLWRRMLSDPARLSQNDPALLLEALDAVESPKFPESPDERRPQAPQVQAG